MLSEIKDILQDKNILILGFGKEGRSTSELLRRWFPDMSFSITDLNKEAVQDVADENICVMHGEDYLKVCNDFDIVIKSPGIPYDQVAQHCDAAHITSQTDLFLRAYGKKVVGVTGTKGKSTTTSLIHHILVSAGRDALLAGNIGVPSLDLAEKIGLDTEVIFEMSSHQLEHISIAPHIAVILNVFPEHLDHYRDFTAYKMAKFNISHMQADGGRLVYNMDDPIITELIHEQPEAKRLMAFSLLDRSSHAYLNNDLLECLGRDDKTYKFPLDQVPDLPGKHNALNLMAAILVCIELGITQTEIASALKTYKRLEHRLEYAGRFRGIHFYNDSIATIPEACIEALNTLEHIDLLILGGHDRKLDYSKLYSRLLEGQTPYLVFLGDAGKRMHEEWNERAKSSGRNILAGNMAEVFKVIDHELKDGEVCLLSPAAASYGMFRNFEERGEVFKKMAAAL